MIVPVKVSIDTSALYARMADGQRRFAYDVEQALRETALAVQAGEKAHLRGVMTIRKDAFVMREAAKIVFPSVRRGQAWTEVYVGQKSRLLLSGFETGGKRAPFKGRRVAIPLTGSAARPVFGINVPEEFTFKGLQLVKNAAAVKRKKGRARSVRVATDVSFGARRTLMGKVQYKGEHRTFLLSHSRKAPEGGVFQRVGPKADDIRMIYSFHASVELDPNEQHRLGFVTTAQGFSDFFHGRLELATLKSIAKSGGPQ